MAGGYTSCCDTEDPAAPSQGNQQQIPDPQPEDNTGNQDKDNTGNQETADKVLSKVEISPYVEVSAMGQKMYFDDKNFTVNIMESNTIQIVAPAFKYGEMTLPSFTIDGIVPGADGTISKEFEVKDADSDSKHVGKISGNYMKQELTYTDKYGAMPVELSFSLFTDLAAKVAGEYDTKAQCKRTDDDGGEWQSDEKEAKLTLENAGEDKLTVKIPEFADAKLSATDVADVAVSVKDGGIVLKSDAVNGVIASNELAITYVVVDADKTYQVTYSITTTKE